jgi:plastocyanin
VAAAAGLLLLGTIIGAFHDRADSDDTPSSASGGTAVEIQGFAFGPETLNVAVGDTVTWTNQDSAEHTVKGDDDIPTQSKPLAQGETYEFTFPEAGTYDYKCTIHDSMQGTIVVGNG